MSLPLVLRWSKTTMRVSLLTIGGTMATTAPIPDRAQDYGFEVSAI
jgi:hypothetical protein